MQRYIFTFVAVVANMLSLCGRDTLRISVLTMREEYLKCMAHNNLNSTVISALPVTAPLDITKLTVNNDSSSPVFQFNRTTLMDIDKEYQSCGQIEWTDTDIAAILSAFNIGVMITGVAGGPLADALSGKAIMLLVGAIQGFCTAALPFVYNINLYWLLASQAISGLAGGFVCPVLTSMVARWEPSCERGRLSTIIYVGSPVSAVLTSVLGGYINHHLDWRIQFYMFGLVQLIWLFPWCYTVFDSPALHPRLKKAERMLLLEETSTSTVRPRMRDIPFLRIMRSKAVWGIIIANIGYMYCKTFTMVILPQYMEVLGLSIEKNGLVSALPPLGCVFTGLLASRLFGCFTKSRYSFTTGRKLATSIGLLGFAGLMALVPVLSSQTLVIIIITTIAYTITGFHLVGAFNTPVDISPNYAGSIMGISFFFQYLTGAFVPHSVAIASAYFAVDQVWPVLFYSTSLIVAISNVAFIILGTSQLQSWNSRPDEQQGVKPGFDAEPGHDNYIEGPDARPPVRDNADVESVKKLVVKDTILQYPVGEEEEKSRFL